MNIEEFARKLPNDLKIHLDIIAKKLSEGHASLMVGAGFSKNAEKIYPNAPNMPSWKELKQKLNDRLYHGKDSEKEVLQLAEEYETVYGKNELENFIRANISDEAFIPNELHKTLLKLPWSDVFTTNYDTLLEKAYQNILTEKKYSIVTKEEQLTNCEPDVSRIIKLHGSFPYDTPFIITEEHYRRYPYDHAIFVNTVQQSLIENALCLIGFSGTDPNFLKWTGWIRDNLSNSANLIYLIECREFSQAERDTLRKKNIIVLNLNDHPMINELKELKHRYAFNRLFNYLKIPTDIVTQSKLWPKNPNNNKFMNADYDKINIHELMQHWKEQREAYPNWFILPFKKREAIKVYTKTYYKILEVEKLNAPNDLNYGYELFWRNKQCLFPLFTDFSKILEKTLLKYNPFPSMICLPKAKYTPELKNQETFDWENIKGKWVEIVFAFIQDARIEMRQDDFSYWLNSVLNKEIVELRADWEARWYYEKCLFAMAKFDLQALEKEYNSWPMRKDQYSEQLWRSGILCELGRVEEAEKLLEKALSFLRKETNQISITNDFYLVDIENYLLATLLTIKKTLHFENIHHNNEHNSFKKTSKNIQSVAQTSNPTQIHSESSKDHADDKYKKNIKETEEEYNKRWEQLKEYHCFYWDEKEYFDTRLKQLTPQPKSHITEVDFFSSNCQNTNFISNEYTDVILAFPLFLEESGKTLKIGGYTTFNEKIVRNMAFWLMNNDRIRVPEAIALCTRQGISKIDKFFTKIMLDNMDEDHLNDLLSLYIGATEKAIKRLPNTSSIYSSGYASNICKVLPGIIGKLSIVASKTNRQKVFKLAMKIYNLQDDIIRNIIQDGLAKLWMGLLNGRTDKEIADYIKQTIKLPVYDEKTSINIFRKDPILYVPHILDSSISKKLKKAIVEDVSLLMDKFNNEKMIKAVVTRITYLLRLGLINNDIERVFSKLLWREVNPQSGLPDVLDDKNKDIVINIPAPNNRIKPAYRYKRYLLSLDFPLRNSNLTVQEPNDRSFTSIGSNFLLARLLLTQCRSNIKNNFTPDVRLSLNEAIKILDKAIEWWNRDKNLLKEKPGKYIDKAKEFRSRFSTLPQILSGVIIPIFRNNSENLIDTQLLTLLQEFKENNIPCALPLVASLMVVPDNVENVKETVINELFSRNFKTANLAYMSVSLWVEINNAVPLNISLPKEIIETFTNMLLNKNCICKESLIQEMAYIVSLNHNNINIDKLCLGLKYLIDDTDFHKEGQNDNNDIEYERRPYFRSLAAGLAFAVFKKLKANKKSIPKVIKQWEKICKESPLPEIKNKWKQ
jgi:SIR2-like protein